MRAWLAAVIAGLALLTSSAAFAQSPPPAQGEGFGAFKDWAAMVVAADFHAHAGTPIEAFDNARRDISNALVRAGFASGHVSQFSVRPERYPAYKPLNVAPAANLVTELRRQSAAAPGGCFLYFTSHGNTDGIVMGKAMLSPRSMAQLLGEGCNGKPTVVVISACFSGVFVPVLAAPNRMIMTAARNDRSSFGCQEDVTYTYFDDCFLQSISAAKTFPALFTATQACVQAKEAVMRTDYAKEWTAACERIADVNTPDKDKAIKTCSAASNDAFPPSEPQAYIGGEIRPLLPLMRLDSKPGT